MPHISESTIPPPPVRWTKQRYFRNHWILMSYSRNVQAPLATWAYLGPFSETRRFWESRVTNQEYCILWNNRGKPHVQTTHPITQFFCLQIGRHVLYQRHFAQKSLNASASVRNDLWVKIGAPLEICHHVEATFHREADGVTIISTTQKSIQDAAFWTEPLNCRSHIPSTLGNSITAVEKIPRHQKHRRRTSGRPDETMQRHDWQIRLLHLRNRFRSAATLTATETQEMQKQSDIAENCVQQSVWGKHKGSSPIWRSVSYTPQTTA